MADYAYAFKAPQQHQYGYHSQAYISPSSSSSSTTNPNLATTSTTNNPIAPPTALLWTDLEPWMDAEYARQVCALMRWDAGVLVPPPSTSNGFSSNAASGASATHPNNAGYAVLSFASAGAAAGALAQVNSSIGAQMTMPNSARPFVLNWAPPGVGAGGAAASSGAQSSQSQSQAQGASAANGSAANNGNNANSGSGSDAADPGSSDYGGGSGGGGGGGGVVSPASPLSPVTATHAGGMGAFGQQLQLQGQSGVGMGTGMGAYHGVGAGVGVGVVGGAAAYPKEYSIFVGDLAPETSNSDLVAVFRNPVLGLRNDRAPKFIRPFASCKSAKIMLDPVTGVSRGYGFVRFTDEADQQRALIEMHGLYCLSRPMRISPATAKFKPLQPDGVSPSGLSTSASAPGYPSPATNAPMPTSVSVSDQQQQQQQQSVSAPIAIAVPSTASYYPGGGDAVAYTPGGGVMSTSASGGGGAGAAYFAQQYGVGVPQQQAPAPSQQQAPVHPPQQQQQQQQQQGTDEWRHTAQARAILGNLIGPNGEQLTSTDPYNTTVFVGGLSPLVGEETLRTFFVPFGEIHYVKVPVGKHCGFVQFVRKADAERAIEKMQGFPVGGSRIRLSWGRSQYKAAQAAAQAAQAAAIAQAQPPAVAAAQVQAPVVPQQAGASNSNSHSSVNAITPAMLEGMTHEQAVMLLQKFQMQGYAAFPSAPGANAYAPPAPASNGANGYSSGVNGGGSYGNASANANGGSYSGGAPSGSGNNANGAEAYRNGFHSSSPSNSNVSEAYGVGGGEARFTDESLKVRRGEEVQPFGYPQRGAYEVPPPSAASGGGGSSSSHSATTSSFSPFSPDPNQHQPHGHGHQGQHQHQQSQHQAQGQIGGLYAAAEMLGKRRDSYAGHGHGAYSAQLSLPHPSKAYAPGFFPVAPALQTPVGGVNRKPIGMGSGSGSGSPTRGGYGSGGGGGFAGSPPAFQVNRYTSHPQTQPISRPNSGSARSVGGGGGGGVASEFDAMRDLNGTLASLDLDRERDREREREREFAIGERAWSLKSPTVTESTTSAESTSSGGSVQFRMTMESP